MGCMAVAGAITAGTLCANRRKLRRRDLCPNRQRYGELDRQYVKESLHSFIQVVKACTHSFLHFLCPFVNSESLDLRQDLQRPIVSLQFSTDTHLRAIRTSRVSLLLAAYADRTVRISTTAYASWIFSEHLDKAVHDLLEFGTVPEGWFPFSQFQEKLVKAVGTYDFP